MATHKMERTVPLILQWDETFDIGADTDTPVDDRDYQLPFPLTANAPSRAEARPAACSACGI